MKRWALLIVTATTSALFAHPSAQAEPLLSQTVQVGADGALIDSLVFVYDGVSRSYVIGK